VIATQLEVYRDRIWFSGPQHWHRYTYPISKKWWEARRGRSLAELQVEAIDWAIAQRMAEPAETVRAERADEVSNLRQLREEIAKSGKPAKPSRLQRMETWDR
jgi:hypothetical protein